ncbi:hypothetical protein FH972_010371 [Carpinus fangiana]|uniref:Uncharacterized protein n=1 Tax=Carpinus fangiana TaxID=176857 RepID=A0A660KV31_9ROSI|nr:hypothetical protein FH972_010371 [Carpinus fangiana]
MGYKKVIREAHRPINRIGRILDNFFLNQSTTKWSVKNTEKGFLLTGGAQVQMENPVTKPMKMQLIPFPCSPSFTSRQRMGEREILVTEMEGNFSLMTRGGVRGGTKKGLTEGFHSHCVGKDAELR